ARRQLGIDHVITGYCEANVADLCRQIADGADGAQVVLEGEAPDAAAVPPIRGASVMGSVELSRGCGLGCEFCTLGGIRMSHLPADTILADAQTNLAAGVRSIALIGEDTFRYGGNGRHVNPDALLDILARLRALDGLRLIQTDHANISSAEQFADEQLRELRRLFVGDQRHRYLWLNLGVETAAGHLLAANGGRGKMGGHDPADWGDVCHEQVQRLIAAGFFPLVSLVLGMPGETEDDVAQTARWVERFRDARLAIFPLFHAPIDGHAPPFRRADMTPAHWRLFRACYRLNFKWTPRLVWDNQAGAGVGLPKRLLLQAMGRGQMAWWKALFVWHSWRAGRARG
ncbi:radical SAM protein, partial [bacterium]|nr:radical SAM protein [bacterium]